MKRLKIWSIVTSILCVLLLILSYFCLLKNQALGQFLAIIAEDITSSGHNPNDLLGILLFFCIIAVCVLFVINQILIYSYVRAAKLEESDEEVVEDRAVVLSTKQSVSNVKTKKSKKKSNTAIDAIEDTVNSAAVAVNSTSNQITSNVNRTNEALAKFLDSFRK